MILPLLQRFADNKLLFCYAASVLLISQFVMSLCVKRVNQLGAGPPPDLRFGYSPDDLNAWYDALGPSGCQVYKTMYRVDLFPFMEAYAIVLGALLLHLCRKVGASPHLAKIFPLTMYFDVAETVIPAYGCEIYPHRRLSDQTIWVAIGANQFKWICFAVGMVLLTGMWLYSMFLPETETVSETVPSAPDGVAQAVAPAPEKKASASSKKKTKTKGKAKSS